MVSLSWEAKVLLLGVITGAVEQVVYFILYFVEQRGYYFRGSHLYCNMAVLIFIHKFHLTHMFLRFYYNEKGDKVYTMKVRVNK